MVHLRNNDDHDEPGKGSCHVQTSDLGLYWGYPAWTNLNHRCKKRSRKNKKR